MWAAIRKAPPLPFLPEDAHGTEVVLLGIFYIGDADLCPAARWHRIGDECPLDAGLQLSFAVNLRVPIW